MTPPLRWANHRGVKWQRNVRWTVAAVAPDQLTAEMWCNLLADSGVSAQVRAGDIASFLGVSSMPCRVIVPEEEAARAWDLLADYLSSEDEVAWEE